MDNRQWERSPAKGQETNRPRYHVRYTVVRCNKIQVQMGNKRRGTRYVRARIDWEKEEWKEARKREGADELPNCFRA